LGLALAFCRSLGSSCCCCGRSLLRLALSSSDGLRLYLSSSSVRFLDASRRLCFRFCDCSSCGSGCGVSGCLLLLLLLGQTSCCCLGFLFSLLGQSSRVCLLGF